MRRRRVPPPNPRAWGKSARGKSQPRRRRLRAACGRSTTWCSPRAPPRGPSRATARSLWEQERKEIKDTSVVVDDEKRTPPVRLFSLNVEDGTLTHLTRNTDWIDSLEVSPDGKWAAVTAQQSLSYEFDETVRPRLYL